MSSTKWISHRGFCLDAVENTPNAFDAAIKLGFTHLETDLRSTIDGHIVLQHDSSLRRSCHSDACIEAVRWEEIGDLKTLDNQSVLRLPELIKAYGDYHWTFDIKSNADTRTLDLLAQWAREEGPEVQNWLQTNCRFLLWTYSGASTARRLFPKVSRLAPEPECYRAGLAVLARVPHLAGIEAGKTYSLPPRFGGIDLFTKSTLAAYHSRNAKLLAYLPDEVEDAKKAYFLGFDEILTNGRKLF